MRKLFLAAAAVALVGLAACKGSGASAGSAGDAGPRGASVRIAVVPKGTTHEYWKAVHAGAVKASREANVDIVWKGPLREDDLKAQVDVVQSFAAQGVSGLVLAPLSDHALANPVREAQAAKIPVVIFDSDLAGVTPVSFVATDNYAAGALAAEEMSTLLGGTGNVLVLRYQEGSASTTNREKGFLDGIKTHAGIVVVSDNQYGGATTETAHATSESVLAAQKAAAGNVQGVFTPNESTTFGMLLALRKSGLAGKVHFVGFDSSDKIVGALDTGEIDALVLQDPFNIGYLSVKTMAASLRGEVVEKRIDTGAKLLTKENLASPEMQTLLHPDLKTWLGE